jgi:hypothetical protein
MRPPEPTAPDAAPGVASGRDAAGLLRTIRTPLLNRLPAIAERMVGEVIAEDQWYAALVAPEPLRMRILANLRQAVDALVEREAGRPVDLADARCTGRERAQQGLPLASLLHAYRLGARLVWDAMIDTTGDRDPAALPVLLRTAGELWEVVDLLSGAVAEAYRQEETERLAHDAERRQAVIDALLLGQGSDGRLVAEASALLGLPERGRFVVAVMRAAPDTSPARDAVGDARSGDPRPEPARLPAGMRVLWRMRTDHEVGLVSLGEGDVNRFTETLPSRAVRVGVSPVVHFCADLGRARWLAEVALLTCAGPGREIARLDQRLPSALVAAQSDLAAQLRSAVLGPVLELGEADRETLLSTLSTWLDGGGSASRAAGYLYCHRNTVFNRLRRVEQLTSRSLQRPWDVVELALALQAVRLATDRTASTPPSAGG